MPLHNSCMLMAYRWLLLCTVAGIAFSRSLTLDPGGSTDLRTLFSGRLGDETSRSLLSAQDDLGSCSVDDSYSFTCRRHVGPLRIAVISSFVPRRCGIAVFSNDLISALLPLLAEGSEVDVFAVTDYVPMIGPYPEIVVFSIREQSLDDYLLAARLIDSGEYDILLVQHEFGIYGGPSGEYVLSVMERVEIPVVVVLHTVVESPTISERLILSAMGSVASAVITLNENSCPTLENYGVDSLKCSYIPHGVPNVPFRSPVKCKEELGLGEKKVVMTFGLINEGKGVEYMIEALYKLSKAHPSILYIVVGETHPHVLAVLRKEYSEILAEVAAKRNVTSHLRFERGFVPNDVLLKYLCAADVYVTPYLGKEQVSSGTLTLAMASGVAVVSTPYVYAEEMLAKERGVLVPFKDSDALVQAVGKLLSEPSYQLLVRCNAYRYLRRYVWDNVAQQFLCEFARVISFARSKGRSRHVSETTKAAPLPPLSAFLDYISEGYRLPFKDALEAAFFIKIQLLRGAEAVKGLPPPAEGFRGSTPTITDAVQYLSSLTTKSALLLRRSDVGRVTVDYFPGGLFRLSNTALRAYGDLQQGRIFLAYASPGTRFGKAFDLNGQFVSFHHNGKPYNHRVGTNIQSYGNRQSSAKDASIEFEDHVVDGHGQTLLSFTCQVSLSAGEPSARFKYIIKVNATVENLWFSSAIDSVSVLVREFEFNRIFLMHRSGESVLRDCGTKKGFVFRRDADPPISWYALLQNSSSPTAFVTVFENTQNLYGVYNDNRGTGLFHWLQNQYAFGTLKHGESVSVAERRLVLARVWSASLGQYDQIFRSLSAAKIEGESKFDYSIPENVGAVLSSMTSLHDAIAGTLSNEASNPAQKRQQQKIPPLLSTLRSFLNKHIPSYFNAEASSSIFELAYAIEAMTQVSSRLDEIFGMPVQEQKTSGVKIQAASSMPTSHCSWRSKMLYLAAEVYTHRVYMAKSDVRFACNTHDRQMRVDCHGAGLFALARLVRVLSLDGRYKSLLQSSLSIGMGDSLLGMIEAQRMLSWNGTCTEKRGASEKLKEGWWSASSAGWLLRGALEMKSFDRSSGIIDSVHQDAVARIVQICREYLKLCVRTTRLGTAYISINHMEDTADVSDQWHVLSALHSLSE
eukprot:CAMPEP_0184364346 /NCGR_PEP_ID=MMETSP1089-20130417/143918_1 /TAXON_ID=38269 ORGANISM="Gloeochaete wittrockiana, Strain SAG46.84" /NCGR_SAMPLE_ID=MMETSP1089 /ASSEMBLY_ACC=CAM_ASM_000445 /LENGTH=1140 /DNA_ID=CAMNT_0026705207 /DNA_START=35 /DNA_END=3457 /DNA_ORIENTATION=-